MCTEINTFKLETPIPFQKLVFWESLGKRWYVAETPKQGILLVQVASTVV